MFVQISHNWGSGDVAAQSPIGTSGLVGFASGAAAVLPSEITVRSATIADMREVEPLIRKFAADNLMLPKSFDQLARTFREFVVAVDATSRIVGCGSLRIYTEELAEICSLAVAEGYQGAGIGRKVVDQLVRDARDLAVGRIFALTLKADFFTKLGFEVVQKENFPLKVWADCRNCPKLNACDEIAVARDV